MSDEDLGALLAGATRRLIEEERPLLEAHGLTMWGYIALSRLADEPAASVLLVALVAIGTVLGQAAYTSLAEVNAAAREGGPR